MTLISPIHIDFVISLISPPFTKIYQIIFYFIQVEISKLSVLFICFNNDYHFPQSLIMMFLSFLYRLFSIHSIFLIIFQYLSPLKLSICQALLKNTQFFIRLIPYPLKFCSKIEIISLIWVVDLFISFKEGVSL